MFSQLAVQQFVLVMFHAQSVPSSSSMFPWASVMQLPVHDVVDLGL